MDIPPTLDTNSIFRSIAHSFPPLDTEEECAIPLPRIGNFENEAAMRAAQDHDAARYGRDAALASAVHLVAYIDGKRNFVTGAAWMDCIHDRDWPSIVRSVQSWLREDATSAALRLVQLCKLVTEIT